MALITFDPGYRGSKPSVLSNENLTAVVTSYNSCARATEGKTSGKWYWEIKYDAGTQAMIGVAGKTTTVNESAWTGNLGRFYYHNANKYPGPTAYGTTMGVGSTIGIAIDLDSPNKSIKFYRNGVSLGVAFTNLQLMTFPIYPYCTTGSSVSTSTFTANFGATEFDIISQNRSEWDLLVAEGYAPYYYPDISVYLDKSSILKTDERISFNITNINNESSLLDFSGIKININDKPIYNGNMVYPLPATINLHLNSSFITQNINTLKIYDKNGIFIKALNIYLENSLLNPIVRDFMNTKVNTMENMQISTGIGTSLNNMTDGNVSLEIPTEMRSKVNKITVDGDVDKILNTSGKYQLSNIDQYLYKTPITLHNNTKLVNTVYQDLNILKGMAPTILTDDNPVTEYNSTSDYTFNFIIPPNVFIRYCKITSEITATITFFGENDIILRTVNATISTFIVDLAGVRKIRLYRPNNYGFSKYIRDFVVYGYYNNIFELFKISNYIIYSNNSFNPKLFIENSLSPIDSTLVKSKKMGNLAFINNSSKVAIKKYDSFIDHTSSKVVRSKIILSNKIPIRRIEIK